MMNTLETITLSGSNTLSKPLFHDNGKLLLASCGSVLQILSIQTGELLYRLCGHSTNITSIIHHPTQSNYIITSSSDGTIIIWNLDINEEIYRITVPLSIIEIIPIISNEKDIQFLPKELILIVGNNSSENESNKIVIYNFERNKIRKNISEMKYTTNCCDLLLTSKSSSSTPFNYLVLANKRKLIFWSLGLPTEEGTQISNIQTTTKKGNETNKNSEEPLVMKQFKGYPGEQIQTICSTTLTTISSLVVCSQRDMIITGHESGEITLWHNISSFLLNAKQKQQEKMSFEPFPPPPCTLLHWHAHPVLCLSISLDSTHFYSGGSEGVLVSWQITTSNHTFVPRLGGTILQMRPSQDHPVVAVSCSDNSLKLINIATMREEWTIQSPCLGVAHSDITHSGITIIDPQTHPSGGKYSKIQIAVNPTSGHIVTNGYPGQLQMTDITSIPFDSKSSLQKPSSSSSSPSSSSFTSSSFVADSIQVLAYNRVSRTENPLSGYDKDRQTSNDLKFYVPSIVQFLFHTFTTPSSASTRISTQFDEKYFLATVDLYRGEELDPDCSLKIWNYSALEGSQRKYVLVTQVDRPHGGQRITSMTFLTLQSNRPALATSSNDGMIKIWASAISTQSNSQSHSWVCLYSFTYRNCFASGLSVCKDSSVLAIGYGTNLTLWNPNSVELKGSIQLPISSSITQTAFIEPRQQSQLGGSVGCGIVYLVAMSADAITVVNIFSLDIVWRLKGHIYSFAAASSDSQVLKFSENDENKSNPISFSSKQLSHEGWFAACMKSDENSETKIHIFSPSTATPISSLTTTATHMTFWRSTDPTSRYSRGLVVVTKESQLLLLAPSTPTATTAGTGIGTSGPVTSINITHNNSFNHKKTHHQPEKRLGLLQGLVAPVLIEESDQNKRKVNAEESESDSEDREAPHQKRRQKKMVANINTDIFDSSSSTLPPLSSIYEDYMKKMMNDSKPPHLQPPPPSDAPPSAPASAPPSVSSTDPIHTQKPTGLDRKRIRSQLQSVFTPSTSTSSPAENLSNVLEDTPAQKKAENGNKKMKKNHEEKVDNDETNEEKEEKGDGEGEGEEVTVGKEKKTKKSKTEKIEKEVEIKTKRSTRGGNKK